MIRSPEKVPASGGERNPNSQSLAIKYLPVHSLLPNPQNPRLHSDRQIEQIARSIEVFGFNVPVLVDADLQGRDGLSLKFQSNMNSSEMY